MEKSENRTKRILIIALVVKFILASIAVAFSAAFFMRILSDCEDTVEESSSSIVSTLSFTLVDGEAGEYGKLITYNKGTEFENTRWAYYVPTGRYRAINKSSHPSQINVYEDGVVITGEGWEEHESGGMSKRVEANQSTEITVEAGQHIEIPGCAFELILQ